MRRSLAASVLAVSVLAVSVLATWLVLAGATARADQKAGLAAYNQGAFQLAADLWRAEAQAGDAESAYLLGVLHMHGVGVARDFEAAAFYLEMARLRGHRQAGGLIARRPVIQAKIAQGICANAAQTGAWSEGLSQPRVSRATPASVNRSAACGDSNK